MRATPGANTYTHSNCDSYFASKSDANSKGYTTIQIAPDPGAPPVTSADEKETQC